jgi:acetylornithine deacetylase/succinyl-diaminopimelate desuccinylase-like protein
MTRSAAIDTVSAYFDNNGFQTELADLVGFETESQTPDQAPELARYLAEAMTPRLAAMGFRCAIHPNPVANAGPFLIAERHEGDDLPTILSYGHGDVIRAQTDQWRAGLHPFRLVEEGDRLYGRGTADNKGQHLINIAALDAVLQTRGALGFNCRIVIETGEETGSPGLAGFFTAHHDKLRADVLIASDGPAINPDWGEKTLTPVERAYGWNSFAILAMTSGVPEAPVNAISALARATCQLRYKPCPTGQTCAPVHIPVAPIAACSRARTV